MGLETERRPHSYTTGINSIVNCTIVVRVHQNVARRPAFTFLLPHSKTLLFEIPTGSIQHPTHKSNHSEQANHQHVDGAGGKTTAAVSSTSVVSQKKLVLFSLLLVLLLLLYDPTLQLSSWHPCPRSSHRRRWWRRQWCVCGSRRRRLRRGGVERRRRHYPVRTTTIQRPPTFGSDCLRGWIANSYQSQNFLAVDGATYCTMRPNRCHNICKDILGGNKP